MGFRLNKAGILQGFSQKCVMKRSIPLNETYLGVHTVFHIAISGVYRLPVIELTTVLAISTHCRPAFLLPETVPGLSTYTGLDVFQLFNYSVTHAAFSSFISL